MLSKRIVFILFSVFVLTSKAQISPFNKAIVQVEDTANFSFLVSGHFYGASSNQSGYPASTLLASLDMLNKSDAAFVMCLGDMFMDVRNNIPNYIHSLFSKLQKPLFNAVGNHDISSDEVYQKKFGETYFYFVIGSNAFVVLDTEINDGSIKSKQMEMLTDVLSSEKVSNVFVFSHRLIWAEQDETLSPLFSDNTRSYISNNFSKEVLPLLDASSKHVYWFSGSLGGNAPSSFFYHPYAENITYIATAIRDLPRDAVLEVQLKNDEVHFNTVSLTRQELKPLEEYNLEFWQANKPKAKVFNKRLLPLYIKNMLKHWMFWTGVIIGFVVLLVLIVLKSKLFGRK
jgi:predicted MPP superfamily phosphohydrolase